MAVNIETAIKYMYDLKSKNIRYSMTGSRTGSDGTGDCSGTIYAGLRKGGATDAGWVLNTDSMHSWLVANGFSLIAENQEWSAKRGDIVIFGLKGASGGAAGHVVIFISNTQIIHCTYKSSSANGVYVDNEATTCPYSMGWYVYRLKEQSNKPNPTPSKPVLPQTEEEDIMFIYEKRQKNGNGTDVYFVFGNKRMHLPTTTHVKEAQDLIARYSGSKTRQVYSNDNFGVAMIEKATELVKLN